MNWAERICASCYRSPPVAWCSPRSTSSSPRKWVDRHPTRSMCTIARELVVTVRNNVTIDFTLRENVRAQLRVLVKRILRKYGYPPDKQEKAAQTVLEQAEILSAGWEA